MDAKQAVREIMALRGWSQMKLAEECGMKGQTNVTGILNRGASMRVDVLMRMVQAMGFEIVLRDKMGSKKEYVLNESENAVNTAKRGEEK